MINEETILRVYASSTSDDFYDLMTSTSYFQVNQKLLLEDLYESRQCNPLLQTETAEEAWPASSDERSMGRQNSQFDAADAYEVRGVKVFERSAASFNRFFALFAYLYILYDNDL